MAELPIESALPEVARALGRTRTVVLEAEPGAGKTTRLPLYLWQSGLAGGDVVVLEPRRLAARLAARYVASLVGEPVGESVGYRVRHEDVTSARTRVHFVTEALLLRRILDDPELRGVSFVVFDEFHERHLASDLALALVRRLQATSRPDLGVVVMSATLETTPVAEALASAEVLRVGGRSFPVTIEHLDRPDDRPLAGQVASAVRRECATGPGGDMLVFLPGAGEIRRAAEACQDVAARHDLLVVPLHGELPPDEQDRAVRPASRRKVILSTNVAETSVTIEGVTTVIDSGLARTAGYDPWSGLPTLRVRPVSRASATQRAGRAGRLAPGRALRLYTRHDFETRPAFDKPEILRADLAELALELETLGLRADELRWLDEPPPAALEAARQLLARIGATGPDGKLSPTGRAMARLPVHPRQARLVLEAGRAGALEGGCLLAALLGERDVRLRRGPAVESGPSDLLALADRLDDARRQGLRGRALTRLELNPGAAAAVDRGRRQLERLARTDRTVAAALRSSPGMRPSSEEEALLWAVLTAYSDRVAQRVPGRSGAADELLLAGGGRARLADASVVRSGDWLVAVDAELLPGGASQRLPLVDLASRIEPDWLLALDSPDLVEATEVVWNEKAARVEEVSRVAFGALTLDESRKPGSDPARASAVLRERALAAGPAAFADAEAIERLAARVAFVRSQDLPDAPGPLDEAEVGGVLAELCVGRSSFAELREADLAGALVSRLPAASRALLARAAPERVELPSGRKLLVHYEPGKPPWVESYLQDFFGLADGPRVALGRVPVTLHLLAPSRRPVQVTTDLAGFWERHYPALRNSLSRRYPRHAWPEDPRHARPPAPKGRQR